ncbi:hypothetical protein XA68_12130 [Ophiocordyceps unilateralis]|uniref:L-2-hydroxyglutarate dehydrogenase, mitochondrial n=1 Tax=Ophiocordyceps unilateralis TaxID=268505 RepID=A0A2A9PFH6_OPHUN|nr:hypothetical protein XA68_12130 [Ophiocordyceps unilateralis]
MPTTKRRLAASSLRSLRAAVRWPPSGSRQSLSSSTTTAGGSDFTHVVIGGGVIGLSIGRQLSLRPNSSTVILERHGSIGRESSSRNSEVLHAGLYYGASSLKAQLCVRGQGLLYDLCARYGVGHKRVGKWLVAQDASQREALQRIYTLATHQLGLSLRWLSDGEIERSGQGVCAVAGALESPATGIVDSHALMTCLQAAFEYRGGIVALNSSVVGIEPLGRCGEAGWRLRVRDGSSSELTSITTETLINAAGLGSVAIHNLIVPPSRRLTLHLAKGSYFSYAAPSPRLSRLVYPAPSPDSAGLGTHLTVDLAGQMRFGPDVEWIDSVHDLAVSSARLPDVVKEVRRYLPSLDPSRLMPDYAGIRPKLSRGPALAGGKDFQDFVIRNEDGYEGWINLLGIESPGLTSCLAIAERVEHLLYGRVSSAD